MVLIGVIAAGFILVIICLYEIDSRLGELSYILDGIDSPFGKGQPPSFSPAAAGAGGPGDVRIGVP